MGMSGNSDGGLRQNASADSYDPVSGTYRPDKMEQAAGQSGANPMLGLLKGGLSGLGQGLQGYGQPRAPMTSRAFYGDY